MEVLFNRSQYSEVMEFYKENTPDDEWKLLLMRCKNDLCFKEYFIKYLIDITEVLRLQMFLSKLFHNATIVTQGSLGDILSSIIASESLFANNEHVNLLRLYQLLKLSLNDISYRGLLRQMIMSKEIKVKMFEEILIGMEFYDEVGLYHEINQDYNKAREYYRKSNNSLKKHEMEEVLSMVNSELFSLNNTNSSQLVLL